MIQPLRSVRRLAMRTSFKLALLSIAIVAIGALAFTRFSGDKPAGKTLPAQKNAAAIAPTATGTAAPQGPTLPERSGLAAPSSQIFSTQSWEPPPPSPPKAARPVLPPPPLAPPLPFTFVGRMLKDGQVFVFLAKGDEVITAKQGDVIAGVYRVDAVTENEIVLNYVPLGQPQSIAVVSSLPRALSPSAPTVASARPPATPAAAAAVPQGTPRARGAALPSSAVVSAVPNAAITQPAAAQAQLEWGGPQNVKLGTRFDVTLRVKSNETLHAWPMQFKFDPNVFEVVTVKPGRAAGGAVPSFDYRVNQNGSIEIGATAQSGTSGSNAELVVLTLIPMRAASAAELNLTSLLLQGPAGRAIAYERIASFKTSITP